MTDAPFAPQHVGPRLRLFRKAVGFDSAAAFARDIGAAPGEVSTWENGIRRPSILKIMPAVERYGVTLDFLFLGRAAGLPVSLARAIEQVREVEAHEGAGGLPDA